MIDVALHSAFDDVPAGGAWAVAVSGGADSVALLTMLVAARPDLSLHVVHLDHQTRGDASTGDATFVAELARSLDIPATVAAFADVRPLLAVEPKNRSALFRAARLAIFRDVVRSRRLAGVVLAHHRLDQAETVLLRLMRGAGPAGLAGMTRTARQGDLSLWRPLLDVGPQALRAWLRQRGQTWREDASNRGGLYRRNRVRGLLSSNAALVDDLVRLAVSCRAVHDWEADHALDLSDRFSTGQLDGFPHVVRQRVALRWLKRVGVPADEASGAVADRLLAMIDDAATASSVDFPGAVRVVRKGRMVGVLGTTTR